MVGKQTTAEVDYKAVSKEIAKAGTVGMQRPCPNKGCIWRSPNNDKITKWGEAVSQVWEHFAVCHTNTEGDPVGAGAPGGKGAEGGLGDQEAKGCQGRQAQEVRQGDCQ